MGDVRKVHKPKKDKAKKAKNSPPVPSEDDEQERIFAWTRYARGALPELDLLFAVPNGGKRNITTAARLKATGVKPGVPDMCLPVARHGYHGLYIELKRLRGGTVSEEQREWLRALGDQGYRTVVCKGSEEAITELAWYLRPDPEEGA